MKKIVSKHRHKMLYILTMGIMFTVGLLSFHKVYSQSSRIEQPKVCGKYVINTAALKAAKDFEIANANRTLNTNYSVRVYFHICRNDNGTNAGATEAQVKTEFNQLVTDYAADNICFINMGLDYINSSVLNNLDPDNSSLVQPYLVPNCINIFYHAAITDAGGTAYSIPSTFCSIARGNIGSSRTISHEVGHCFGLLHTFEPLYGYENINGSNSSEEGDQITDTPADPYVYKGETCFTTSTCCYTGNCTDPNGQTNFSPPYNNMMAYWWKFGYTNLNITSAQFTRINSYLSTNNDLQSCESPASLVVGPVTYTSGYHMLSAINTLTSSGSVNLSGSTVTTLGGGIVSLAPGFIASASGGALILVRPSSCVAGTSRSAFENKSEISSAIRINESNANIITNTQVLRCYPNPFLQQFTVEFSLAKDDEATIQLYDLSGRRLKIISNSFFKKGVNQVITDASSLPSGIYIIVIQTAQFKKEQKIVKIK